MNATLGFCTTSDGMARFGFGVDTATARVSRSPPKVASTVPRLGSAGDAERSLPLRFVVDASGSETASAPATSDDATLFATHAFAALAGQSASPEVRADALVQFGPIGGARAAGSVCATTLALADAEILLPRPVAALHTAVLMHASNASFLLDASDSETGFADAQMRVAATDRGITAIQVRARRAIVAEGWFRDALLDTNRALQPVLERLADLMPSASRVPAKTNYAVWDAGPERIESLTRLQSLTLKSLGEFVGARIRFCANGCVIVLSSSQELERQAIERLEALTALPVAGAQHIGLVAQVFDQGAVVLLTPRPD